MGSKKSWLRKDLDALRLQWDMLTFYERFEQLVVHVLSVVISIIILVFRPVRLHRSRRLHLRWWHWGSSTG